MTPADRIKPAMIENSLILRRRLGSIVQAQKGFATDEHRREVARA